MSIEYAYDNITTCEILSQSLEMILPETRITSISKNKEFRSYGDGLIDKNFFIGNVHTDNVEKIIINNLESYVISLPKHGVYSVISKSNKNVNTPKETGSIILPCEKVIYDTPTQFVEDFEVFIHKEAIDKILDIKYNMPHIRPDMIVLALKNSKVQALCKFIESTLSILRSFPDSRESNFVKKSIKDISTLMTADIIAECTNAKPTTNNFPDKDIVGRVEELIDSECETLFSIQEIADKLFTNPRNIQIAFKKYRNYSPMQFLKNRKLHKAHDYIIFYSGRCTVKEIALSVGIFDLNRFSKYYAKLFGELPSQTIKKQQI